MSAAKKTREIRLSKLARSISIVVLLALAIVLGNLVGSRVFSDRSEPQDTQKEEETDTSAQPQEGLQEGISPESKSTTMVIAGVEVKTPGTDSTDEEKREFMNTISELAQESDSLEIGSDCQLTPQVVRTTSGSEFKLVNKDSSEHAIQIFEEEFTLAANSTQTITADFGPGRGIFGISCDDRGTLGFMELVA